MLRYLSLQFLYNSKSIACENEVFKRGTSVLNRFLKLINSLLYRHLYCININKHTLTLNICEQNVYYRIVKFCVGKINFM